MTRQVWHFRTSVVSPEHHFFMSSDLLCPYIIRVLKDGYMIYDIRLGIGTPDFNFYGYSKIKKLGTLDSAKNRVRFLLKAERDIKNLETIGTELALNRNRV